MNNKNRVDGNKKEFDYYIYIDYSENLIGYNIIEKDKIKELLLKISKLKHYKNLKYKREYLNSMKKLFVRNKIESYLLKHKIRKMRDNLEVYTDIIDLIKKEKDKIIFISVDDKQYKRFKKLIKNLDVTNVKIEKEGKLKKDSAEYRMSLIIDTKLNLERRKQKA